MSDFYNGLILLTVLGMVVMCFIVHSNPTLPVRKKKSFIFSFVALMIGAVLEWTGVALQTYTDLVLLTTVIKTLELMIVPFIPLLILPAIDDDKVLLRFLFAVVMVNVVLEFLSSFLGFIFYVDANNVYHHGKVYFLYILSYFAGIICLLIGSIRVVRVYQSRSTKLFYLIMGFILVGVGIQIVFSSVKISFIAIAMGMIFLYIGHEDVIRSSDSLTKLLNRHSFENLVSNIDKEVTIINLDIDYFKQCNDTYGHVYGDTVLKTTAHIIRSCYGRIGFCYRTGGDEFCVVIPGKRDDAEALVESVHQKMSEQRAAMPLLPFISTGYAYFTPGQGTFVEAEEKADTMMYRFKNLRKKLWSEGKNPTFPEIQMILTSTPLGEAAKD